MNTWSATFDATAGDYRVIVTDSGSRATSDVMARSVPCVRGERHLVVHEIGPGTLVRVGAEPRLLVPRWHRQDQDFSFVVEWLRDGKLVYEVSGRTDPLERHLTDIEGVHGSASFDEMCAFEPVEEYTAPDLEHGAWEVRVYREGAESLTASFVVESGQREVALPFVPMARPGKGAARVARVPAYAGRTMIKNVTTGEETGWPSFPGEMAHDRTGAAVAATAAEFRALMRDAEVYEIRKKMDEIISGKEPIDRPDFEYDSEQSPDTNWHRRKEWEKRDSDRQFTSERILASRARAKYRAALLASVKRHGGPWQPEEIPAPMPALPAR
jgi:hypothetical protein